MKAVCLLGKENFEIREVDIPKFNDDEILLKVKAASVCGSDVRMILNGYKNISEDNPLILGHEFAGVIEDVGKNISEYKKGMRVSVAPNMGCGVCDNCISGDTHLCENYEAFGINMPGGFAEYVVIPKKAINQGNIKILSDSISFEEASLAEPFSCVVNGQEITGIKPGDKVLIIGSGPIGIMHAMYAKLQGASKVMMNDLQEDRLKTAKEIVPELIILTSESLSEKIKKETNGKGVDVCIIAAPSGIAQESSLNYMAMNGKVLFFGGLAKGKEFVSLDSNVIHYKQLRIFGSARANVRQYRLVVDLIENKVLDISKIITKTENILNFEKAFELARKAEGLKNIIKF